MHPPLTFGRHRLEPGIITVLTADSLRRADDMLAFFVEHDLRDLSFSVEEREGANAASSLEFAGVEHAVEEFLLRFMQDVVRKNLPIRVREAERILTLLAAGGSAVGANEQTEALAVITVDWTVGVYTYSPEFTEHAIGEWEHLRLGNVHTHTSAEIESGESLRRLMREVSEGLAECATTCTFWEICGGGSPVNRLRGARLARRRRCGYPILGLFAPLPGAKFSQEGGLIGAPMPMVSARDLHPDPRNSKPLTKPADQLTREPNAVPTNRATH